MGTRRLIRWAGRGGDGDRRVQTGDHRIVYEIHDRVPLVLLEAVGHRRDMHQHG